MQVWTRGDFSVLLAIPTALLQGIGTSDSPVGTTYHRSTSFTARSRNVSVLKVHSAEHFARVHLVVTVCGGFTPLTYVERSRSMNVQHDSRFALPLEGYKRIGRGPCRLAALTRIKASFFFLIFWWSHVMGQHSRKQAWLVGPRKIGGEVRRAGTAKCSDAEIGDRRKKFGHGQTYPEKAKIRSDGRKKHKFLRSALCLVSTCVRRLSDVIAY